MVGDRKNNEEKCWNSVHVLFFLSILMEKEWRKSFGDGRVIRRMERDESKVNHFLRAQKKGGKKLVCLFYWRGA